MVTAVVPVVLLAAACADARADGSAFTQLSPSSHCFGRKPGEVRAYGTGWLTNETSADVTILDVSFENLTGFVEDGDAVLVPEFRTADGGSMTYTVGGPMPPDPTDEVGQAVWAQRRNAVGAVIAEGESLQLLVPMRQTADVGGFDHVVVEYKVAGKRGTGTWLGPTDVAFGTTGPGPCEGLDEMMPSED